MPDVNILTDALLAVGTGTASAAAARVTWVGLGEATQVVSTPATRAGITVIRTDEGRGCRPPGA